MTIPNNKIRLVLGGFLTAMASLITTAQAVPTVWGVNGHSYEVFSSAGINWNNASAAANNLGGHLATITDASEDAFVLNLIQATRLGQVWSGGYQNPGVTPVGAGWQWVTGEAWSYTNWSPGEPNDYYGPNQLEQHLGLNWGAGQWNDEWNLGNLSGYVVEWSGRVSGPNRVPDGGTTALLMGASFIGLYYFRRK